MYGNPQISPELPPQGDPGTPKGDPGTSKPLPQRETQESPNWSQEPPKPCPKGDTGTPKVDKEGQGVLGSRANPGVWRGLIQAEGSSGFSLEVQGILGFSLGGQGVWGAHAGWWWLGAAPGSQ